MYTQLVEFRFNDEIPPSRRFGFLAELGNACEQDPLRRSNHSYFAISIERNGQCRVEFMMPSVFGVGKARLRMAQRDGLLTVTKPKNFAKEDDQPDKLDV
jgi:hypothetical protein